jgi:hypothetical protein
MERIENNGDTVIRYDDDINRDGINIVVKAIRRRYPFVVGYRVRNITSVIFIELRIDCGMLGRELESGREIYYLDNIFGGVERDVDEKIKEMVKELYKELPEEIVNFHYAKYDWSDKEFRSRSGLFMIGFYCK